jgi:hypothetical protein
MNGDEDADELPHEGALADLVDEIHSASPTGAPFSALKNTTAVLSATITQKRPAAEEPSPYEGVVPAALLKGRLKHKVLMADLQAHCAKYPLEDEIVVVNSNFGAVWQPAHEHRVKSSGRQQPIAPAGHRHRQPEGHGGSFNSALEPICAIAANSEVGRALAKKDEKSRVYKMKFFPSSGSTQVSGVVLPDYADGLRAFDAWVGLLNKTNLLGSPAGIAPGTLAVEMANFKFQLRRSSTRQVIDFDQLCAVMTDPDSPIPLPAPIEASTIKYPVEGAKASFKMSWTDGRRKKQPRVNLFLNSGRINLLGFPSREFAEEVYRYLEDVFLSAWPNLVVLQPLPDSAPPICHSEVAGALEILYAKMVPDPPADPNAGDWAALF